MAVDAKDAKRARAWARLSDAEKARAPRLLEGTAVVRPGVPPFTAATSAYEKVLHALVAAGEPLSPPEIAYLLIAGRGFNTDIASIRRRLALAVQQGEARSAGEDRYFATDLAIEHLQNPGRRFRPGPQTPTTGGPASRREVRAPMGSGDLRDRRPPREPRRRDDPAR